MARGDGARTAVPAYVIFHDSTLAESRRRAAMPTPCRDQRHRRGKLERYGRAVLELLRQ